MIYDRIENMSRYRGLSENLDRAISFIEHGGLADTPLARHEVCGERVFLNHFQYDTALPDEPPSRFEAHRKHMDLHILLSGQEYVAVTPIEMLKPVRTIEREDSVLYTGQITTKVYLSRRWFVLLCPGEGHMGKLAARDGQNHVDKVVFKISID